MNRLFEMVYLLMERESMTAAQLAEHFEVSSRTIYRDMDALSSAGIPVYATKGKGGGIRLLPDFVLNKSLLSEREQNEILFALQSLSATQGAECDGILSRMSGLFRKEPVDWIDVDFSHWGSGTEEKEKFQALKTGILERRAVTFVYHSSYGEQSERKVNPVKLRFKSASWYLQGICQKKQAYRTFKICRMQKVQVTEERFSPPAEPAPPLDIAPWEGVFLVSLELLFSPRVAFRVYDEFDPDQIERQEDGSFRVCVQYPAGDWIPGYLLSFGEDVQVLSPPDIRRLLEEKVKKIAEIYQPDENMTYSCPISSAIVETEQKEREENIMKQDVFCQSCGMPMTEEAHFGTNADGSRNEDYCCYCYKEGAFTAPCTMEQMIDFCLNYEKDSGRYQNREEAKQAMMEWFPTLKRWKQEK